MHLQVSCELVFDIIESATFIFSVQPQSNPYQQILSENIITSPDTLAIEKFAQGINANPNLRIHNAEKGLFTFTYSAEVVVDKKLPATTGYTDVAVQDMDTGIISYLFPSRYCPCDQLYKFAEIEFSHFSTNFEKVTAIEAWIFKNIQYAPGTTNETTSATDVLIKREGVCRDFAHLGISFCRALTIPARYVACYSYGLVPQDFHAYFEAYLGGEWIAFDATRMAAIDGFVNIAIGHDAADTSFSNFFGNVMPISVKVNCTKVT